MNFGVNKDLKDADPIEVAKENIKKNKEES